MKVLQFEDGYTGKLCRTNRTSGAKWTWTLLRGGSDNVVNSGICDSYGEAETALKAAYELVAPKSEVAEVAAEQAEEATAAQ